MAISVESSSPSPSLVKGPSSSSPRPMGPSPARSPSSDEHFWSTLRSRVDVLLENRKSLDQTGGAEERTKRMKEDSMLLLRGFDSVSSTLSQLSSNLESALQGARDLAKPPTLTEILHSNLENARSGENNPEADNRGLKRKYESKECSDDPIEDENVQGKKELGKLKIAKNIAVSMATKAAAFARELKTLKSDLTFVKERCSLLEEENRRLRDGFPKGVVPPEEDDLVRLQLEALLAEKSRLANENASLSRENQCLRQLVEYHQFASQDLSASYENLLRSVGMSLDFTADDEQGDDDNDGNGELETTASPGDSILGLFKSLDECYDDEDCEKQE
ncbi:PREDICTED: uncharacterized protein LOC109160777 [Ipomoea nil]|uniref:uncharacterized protein LOC109160777 n=1 Tax=Ipomoea nil TaxID=35883 RepID=UPI00090108B7|nr:PREDICTED: uncharacterized protein LOC109160777 [Ipomoea nil]